MTTKEIIENNILIAKFMKCPEEDGCFGIDMLDFSVRYWGEFSTRSINVETDDDYDNIYYAFTPLEMLYNTSWDWLMPVIRKCAERTQMNSMYLQADTNKSLTILTMRIYAKIEYVYEVVLRFIKWYNSQTDIN